MLPGFKSNDEQLVLFQQHIVLGNHGHVRTILGDFAESLTANLFEGYRYRTDSRCKYCPDITTRSGIYLEVKTLGKSNHTFIYEGRLKKDRAFYDAGNKLFYVLWHHSADTRICTDDFELKCLFLSTLKRIVLVEFPVMETVAKMSAVTKLNSKYGHSDSNPTYGAGYRIPISRILKAKHLEIDITLDRKLF
jgi:hypothetical protein